VYPALAVADSLRAIGNIDIHLVGTKTGLERKLFEESGLPGHYLMARPLPARKGPRWAANCLSIGGALVQAVLLLRRLRPRVVAGTGGYASVCVIRAAQLLGVPTLVHEMDAHAGRANRAVVRRATKVTVGFSSAASELGRPDAVVTGNPLRPQFHSPDPAGAAERYGLEAGRRTVLVLGGSRGAVALTEAAVGAAPDVSAAGAQLVVIAGRGNMEQAERWAKELPTEARAQLHLVEYVSEGIADLFAAADLAVCRAGAATVFELAATGLPAILIPYPYATGDHQRRNAQALAEAGAALLVDQAEVVGPGLLGGLLRGLLNEENRLRRMSAAARAWARPDAAAEIARLVFELASPGTASEE